MQYRTLGTSGAVVSNYALGTMTFGAEATEEQSHAILDDYFAAGGNFIDTADVYAAGSRRRSSAAGWPRARRPGTAWCWPPRAASRWDRPRTTSAPPAGT